MKKVVIDRPGGYGELKIKEFPNPHPGKNEVLVEVHAAGVNFADCCVRMGVYQSAKEFVGWPITPGFEVAGIVSEVGEGVTQFSPGQKVIAFTLFGGYTTHLVVPENQVILLPESLTLVQGAAFPVVFLTAYYALFTLAHPKAKEVVLVHSAAGGVGSALVQLGKLIGCEIIGVVGSSHKISAVKDLGAHGVIDKSQQNLWEAAKRFAPNGYNIIFDANGAETLRSSYDHLKPGGRLVVYGFHSMFSKGRGTPNWMKLLWDYWRTPRFNPMEMTNQNRSVLAFNLSYFFDKNHFLQEAVHKLLNWLSDHTIKPIPIKTYLLEEVALAHKDLETGQTVGKLVLVT